MPEVQSAEQASKRYGNEARCFGTRCCVDPELSLRGESTGTARRVFILFILTYFSIVILYDRIKNKIWLVRYYFIVWFRHDSRGPVQVVWTRETGK